MIITFLLLYKICKCAVGLNINMRVRVTVTLTLANGANEISWSFVGCLIQRPNSMHTPLNLFLALGQAITDSTSCYFPCYHDNLSHYGFRLLETSQEAFSKKKKKRSLLVFMLRAPELLRNVSYMTKKNSRQLMKIYVRTCTSTFSFFPHNLDTT